MCNRFYLLISSSKKKTNNEEEDVCNNVKFCGQCIKNVSDDDYWKIINLTKVAFCVQKKNTTFKLGKFLHKSEISN